MPRPFWSRSPRGDSLDSEWKRIALYEPIQRNACESARAPFVAPNYEKQVWLGPLIPEGDELVHGTRHAETDGWSGWSLIADGRPKPAPNEVRFEHLRHLVSIREDLMPYLGLPVGWSFATFGDGSWHVWSPRDRLLTWLDNFLSGRGATPGDATAIADLIDEQFDGTELHAVVEPLLAWAARDDASPDLLTRQLASGLDWLRASPIR